MTENDVLRQKFARLGYGKIAPFVRAINSCLSEETWGRMLKRNKSIDLKTLLIATAELNFSSAELRSVLLMRGEKIIAELISPTTVGPTEQKLLDKYRGLGGDQVKTKLLFDLLDQMQPQPCERCGGKKGT